jgi:hypothetical protein
MLNESVNQRDNRTRNNQESYVDRLGDLPTNQASAPVVSNIAKLQLEIASYSTLPYTQLSINRPEDERDGLLFWKHNSNNYPILSGIVRSIFSIPATSVPSECLFSTVGLIQTDLRNRLAQETLQSITILKENMNFF